MSSLLISSPAILTIGDLLDKLGGVPAERVRYYPLPGTATEEDLLELHLREGRLCELIDGVLVEKPMGFAESYIAVLIATALASFVDTRELGIVTGADGMMRLSPGLIRIPDVAFISGSHFPNGTVPLTPIPSVAPDLAVEVLSKGNTRREMELKLHEYFDAGVRLVWIFDPQARNVTAFTSVDQQVVLHEGELLDGGAVLPGFELNIEMIYAKLEKPR